MEGFYQWQNDDLILKVKVNPNASRNKLEPTPELLRVKISTPPIEGKANKHLARYLAEFFAVSTSKVSIERGEYQAFKTLRISEPNTLPAFISPRFTP